jgi:hypothetical protein
VTRQVAPMCAWLLSFSNASAIHGHRSTRHIKGHSLDVATRSAYQAQPAARTTSRVQQTQSPQGSEPWTGSGEPDAASVHPPSLPTQPRDCVPSATVGQAGRPSYVKPIGYTLSYLTCSIGHLVPIWNAGRVVWRLSRPASLATSECQLCAAPMLHFGPIY